MATANQLSQAKPSRNSILGLILVIAIVIAALILFDALLEKAEQKELLSGAKQNYVEGSRLVQQGKLEQGVDLLRKAHALERANSVYELGLIDALVADKKLDQAEPLMNEILLREPNDGRANLSAARLMVEKKRTAEAISYYHRAIYGEWAEKAEDHRISVRVELVEFLVSSDRNGELLAELLPLQEEAKKDMKIQRELGHLFLLAGSPSRAVSAYQALIDDDRKDADAYAGLGEAELERGDYRAAHEALASALRLKPGDASIRQKLQLSSAIIDLDPTSRRLPSMEKYARSVHILQLAYADLNDCVAKHPDTPSSDTTQLLTDVQAMLVSKPPTPVTNEFSESVLGMAGKTWHARIDMCGANTSPAEEPLRLIVEKLDQ